MPTRLLFLNSRDQCGADVAVHLELMRSFDPDEVAIHVISNSEAADVLDMRKRLGALPDVTSTFMPLGKPASALADRSKLGKTLSYCPALASLAKAAVYVRKHRIQVIHSTDRPRDASFASLLGRMTGAVSVVHMHAHVSDLSRPTVWGMRNATAILAVSESTRRNLIDLGLEAKKIYTVHNAVDADFFDPDAQVALSPSIREQFRIPREAPLAGIAARMNPWKGQIELIDAAVLLRERFPDLHVMILGADVPEMRKEYEKRARAGGVIDRIHFGGYQQDVRPFLQEFDLFVHPSYGEPFGLSIVEAMAMRKPVIACNSGGVPEIITHGTDGWLVEERCAEAVAAGIGTLLDNRELRIKMGERARETVSRRFTPRQQAAAVAELYAQLVTAGRSPRIVSSTVSN